MPKKPTPAAITRADVALLTFAIDEADSWRGSYHPDSWPDFDSRIAQMREALAKVRRLQREARALRKEVTCLRARVDRLLAD